MQTQTEMAQIHDMTVKQRIERAIEMIDEVMRDIKEDEWERLLYATKVLSSAIAALEVMRSYMDNLADSLLKTNDMAVKQIYVESLKRWIQHLA